jgi:glycosyltransferase involved in cell wall biosynthesis
MGIKFSIIITSHLRPYLLARSLQSLLMQEFEDFEVIVAMDAWCRDSIDAVNQFQHSKKKLLVLPECKGPAETRNIGKEHAVGDWILFLDDDDQLAPGYLLGLQQFTVDKNRILWSNYVVQEEIISGDRFDSLGWNKIIIYDRSAEELEISNFIPNSALVYSREMIKNLKFDLCLNSLEDWDFLIQVKRKLPMESTPLFSAVISMPNNQLTRNSGSQQSNDHFMDIISIYRKWRSSSDLVRKARFKKINGRHLKLNESHL